MIESESQRKNPISQDIREAKQTPMSREIEIRKMSDETMEGSKTRDSQLVRRFVVWSTHTE